MSLGSRIRKARQAKNWSQETVGSMLGVSTQAVSQWERESTRPSFDKMLDIAQTLGVTLEWLTQDAGRGGPAISRPQESGALAKAPLASQLPNGWWNFRDEQFSRYTKSGLQVSQVILGVAIALDIHGAEMSPEIVPDDIVIFDTGVAPRQGDIVIATNGRDILFSQYRIRSYLSDEAYVITLTPRNPNFAPYDLELTGPNRIIGTAVELRRFRTDSEQNPFLRY